MEPHYNHEPDPETPTRRKVMGSLIGLINAGLAAAIALPALAFLVDPLRRKYATGDWIAVLDDSALAEGETKYVTFEMLVDDGYMKSVRNASVYVSRKGSRLVAYDPSCPHLGCHVEYKKKRDRYICPCHGGVFDSDGERVSGPPPRGLTKIPTRTDGGRIWIRKA
ncbi:ubiquinol-cytochrome c reductase iron-sulfur subunit [Armatimonas rosea]|uniref:Menaquinol-cytochrome c reductase iron-sulfur subunit n=1 Tax=Armatimonas rosea TaxID=685828 RepID=A0A7W9SW01_ARMRO|nr:Rieske (2Fe-2S) protein [Armatimonas rosea]MBB6053846.1 menaquinol-cytochrome c reductase iron-sulfur subunit [Armatimonas rosea]